MTTPNYTDNERAARALLNEEANRILMANPCLISAKVQIDNTEESYAVLVWVQDSIGEKHCGMGPCITDALRSAMSKITTARGLAEQKRARAAELLAEAARLEETAAA